MVEENEALDNKLKRIIEDFPPAEFAFGYGSAIFPQENFSTEDLMIDLIFGVKSAITWHQQNLKQNWGHYSWLKLGGSRLISHIQRNYSASIYYNVDVTVKSSENAKLKYGVIELDDLKKDLMEWKTLYVSGRLHKPVKFLLDSFNLFFDGS